jgi:hypothetical protein
MVFQASVIGLCRGPVPLIAPWRTGPLPVPLSHGGVADRARRSTYFEERAARTLYGTERRPLRAHVVPGQPAPLGGSLAVVALEVLDASQLHVGSLLVVHIDAIEGSSPEEVAESWADTVRWKRDASRRQRLVEAIDRILGSPLDLQPIGEEPFHLAFVADSRPSIDEVHAAVGHPPQDQWLLLAATGADGAEAPVGVEQVLTFGERLTLSADWSALVLRNGAGFVAHPVASREFVERHAPVYVRTIYLDVFLLGVLQRRAIAGIVRRLSRIDDPAREPRSIERLSAELSRFRSALWWQHLAQHGIGTELLTAYQRQHLLPGLVEQTRQDLVDFSQQASLRGGRILNGLATLLAVAAALGAAADLYSLYAGGLAPPRLVVVGTAVAAGVLILAAIFAGRVRSPRSVLRRSTGA